ncbi:hypothetical protein J3R83DRAFT_11828 [Lanmaoa asiatica]|nr:hypothetical protein J3R83DRAFT_11828 [Lanmaoa asiatica]
MADPSLEVRPNFASNAYRIVREALMNTYNEDVPQAIERLTPEKLSRRNQKSTTSTRTAILRINSFDFVELWYFSPEGCSEAAKNHRSQADGILGLTRNARPDHGLSFSEFLRAKNSFLHHIKQVPWPDKHVNALAEFFWNLGNHPIRVSENGDLIALHYASRVRQRWHEDLKNNTGAAFDISLINDTLMNNIAFEINFNIQAEIIRKAESILETRVPSSRSRRSRRSYNHKPESHADRRRSSRSLSPTAIDFANPTNPPPDITHPQLPEKSQQVFQ